MPTDARQLIQNATQGYSAEIVDLRNKAIKSMPERKENEIKAMEERPEGVRIGLEKNR